MFYTLEIYKRDRRLKAGVRLVGKYDYERPDREAMEREIAALYPTYKRADGYVFNVVETYVKARNFMTGEDYMERYDVPYTASPRSETYWST